jgi:uncharacterized membrane protein YgcG
MKPSLQERLEQDPEHTINLSPLIDVVFILLIFFIVTTVFVKETGVKVEKPVAGHHPCRRSDLRPQQYRGFRRSFHDLRVADGSGEAGGDPGGSEGLGRSSG